ncbi:VOC family protein [Dactylosporangium sp. CA-139066]|uniref:VOC family protein n=1 Tax=Dactylosporangium sp. CA-139066 TaxID=3239930 RepID=UPI003D8E5F86
MAHFSRLFAIVIDAPRPAHEATVAFWSGAAGVELPVVEKYPEFNGARLPNHDMLLLTQQLGDGPARIHLDFHTDDLEAEVARLEALGATRETRAENWQVMRDPAGLIFCVVQDRPGTLHESNATRWE